MNQLIIRMARRWWYPAATARVTVSGFAAAQLHGSNAYMEWLLPAGNYSVCIETYGQQQRLDYNLKGGESVEVLVKPPMSPGSKKALWLCTLLLGAGLLLSALWWELTHEYYLLAAGTLLVVMAAALGMYRPWQMLRWRVQQHRLYGT
jgi:hypothetical protein